MTFITSHPFIEMVRKIERTGQHTIEEEYELELYEDSIRSTYQHYRLNDVFDVSYRFTTGNYGFLYLHTNRGVISFMIKEDPHSFVEEYKKLI